MPKPGQKQSQSLVESMSQEEEEAHDKKMAALEEAWHKREWERKNREAALDTPYANEDEWHKAQWERKNREAALDTEDFYEGATPAQRAAAIASEKAFDAEQMRKFKAKHIPPKVQTAMREHFNKGKAPPMYDQPDGTTSVIRPPSGWPGSITPTIPASMTEREWRNRPVGPEEEYLDAMHRAAMRFSPEPDKPKPKPLGFLDSILEQLK